MSALGCGYLLTQARTRQATGAAGASAQLHTGTVTVAKMGCERPILVLVCFPRRGGAAAETTYRANVSRVTVFRGFVVDAAEQTQKYIKYVPLDVLLCRERPPVTPMS